MFGEPFALVNEPPTNSRPSGVVARVQAVPFSFGRNAEFHSPVSTLNEARYGWSMSVPLAPCLTYSNLPAT